jgi:hypothetical protein
VSLSTKLSGSRPTEYTRRLDEHADAIRECRERTLENLVAIGRHLLEARKLVGSGGWLSWLKQEFAWSESTARNLMRLAAHPQRVADLKIPVRSLYLLAAPSTPEPVRKKLLKKAKARPVEHGEVVQAVRAAKPIIEPIPRTAKPTLPAQLGQYHKTVPPPVAESKPAVNFLLYTSVIEAHARRMFEGGSELWHDAIEHQADMPGEYRQRIVACNSSQRVALDADQSRQGRLCPVGRIEARPVSAP